MRLADRRLTFPLKCGVNYWLDGSMPARCFVSARQDMFWQFYPPGSVVLGILLLFSSLFPFLLPLDMATFFGLYVIDVAVSKLIHKISSLVTGKR